MRSGHTLPFIDRYFILYIPFQSIILSGLLLLIKKPVYRWPSAAFACILFVVFSKMLFSNIQREILSSNPKEVSLDVLFTQLPKSTTFSFSAKSLCSALVVALKGSDLGAEEFYIHINPKKENGIFGDAP